MARCLEAVSVDKLEGFLVCSICLETLKDPRTLPCFHSYCKSCLEKFVKNLRDKSVGRQTKKFNCPNCRSQFTLHPGQEVADMTTNHFVCNMLDVVAVQDRVKGVPCSHCQGPSVGRCVTCEVFLCRECLTDHNKYRGFKDHSVLTMDELSEPENQGAIRGRLYCKEHSKKALKFYCETCSELICRYCMDFNHVKPAHSCLPVEKVADKEKKLLASQCITLAMELKCGKKQFKAISDVKQSLERSKEQVTRDINSRKDTLLSAVTQQLNEEVERLMGKVEEIYNTKYGALTKQQEDLAGYVDKLEGRVNLFNQLLVKGTNEEILSSTKMIKENMETMQPQPEAVRNLTPVGDGHIDYKYDTTDALSMPEIISKMGKVKLDYRNGQLMHKLSEKVKLIVYQGDITEEKVDAIVNSANENLQHCGGAAEAILKRGGNIIQHQSDDIMKKRGRPFQPGNVEVTPGGELPCQFIVHAVGPRWSDHSADQSRQLLGKAVWKSLKIASENHAQTIALPAISSGIFGVPVKICAEVLFDSVAEFAKAATDSENLEEIRFVNIDQKTTQVFQEEMRKRYGDAVSSRKEKINENGHSISNGGTNTSMGRNTNEMSQQSVTHGNGRGRGSGRKGNNNSEPGGQHPQPNPNASTTVKGDHSVMHPPSYSEAVRTDLKSRSDNDTTDSSKCSICLDRMTNPKALPKCGHSFCTECIDNAFKHQQKCPLCGEVYGVLTGNQPPGQMTTSTSSNFLPGFTGAGTITIHYSFNYGTQGPNHPNPGRYYSGTGCTAYLPNNKEGQKVLKLLKKAFDQKLTFTIGRSTTTGRENTVTWNDIHHKTNMTGGPASFGYPDPSYLQRVQEELAAKGIKE